MGTPRCTPFDTAHPIIISSDGPACPVCGGRGSPRFLSGSHKMYRCKTCRTAFVDPMPSKSYLAEFYSNYHLGLGAAGNYVNEDKMMAHHPAQLAAVRRHSSGNPGRLLDIGCGKGFFLKQAAESGIECCGIELSNTAVEYATRNLHLDVVQGIIGDCKGKLGFFDSVTLWGVIEHLPDPVKVLRDAYEVLRPRGRIFVQTGIGDDWLDRLLPGVNQWYDPPQHLFVFSSIGLARCLEASGFEVVHRDTAYDRSVARRVVRLVRNGFVGTLLRGVCELGRLKSGSFQMTKFPLANEMFVVAQKP